VFRYFSGELLDASSFELEQQYFVKRRGRGTAIWLELDEGDGFEPWFEVAEFSRCGADERRFVLDRASAVVRFGDGRIGRRPRVGAMVRGWYRLGSGAAGNAGELVSLLAEVSHFTWMRQAARDKGCRYEALDPAPTEDDRERAEDIVAELERIGLPAGRA
jgi:hypothetical protein